MNFTEVVPCRPVCPKQRLTLCSVHLCWLELSVSLSCLSVLPVCGPSCTDPLSANGTRTSTFAPPSPDQPPSLNPPGPDDAALISVVSPAAPPAVSTSIWWANNPPLEKCQLSAPNPSTLERRTGPETSPSSRRSVSCSPRPSSSYWTPQKP